VRVRAYGAWRTVDVHALPFEGAPLVAAVAVDYPVGALEASAAAPAPSALVVGDPKGDLPRAATEARAVTKILDAKKIPFKLMSGSEATSNAVIDWMKKATLFHYAGHGVFAGAEGFESALPLAEGGRVTIADVLATSPGPRIVVLSGCDAAKSDGDAEGLGLAQAFVAAGALEVLAPTRPVADDLAADVATAVHETLAEDDGAAAGASSGALARALRDASRRVWAGDGGGAGRDVAAFRVLSR
jgi:cellulose synthase operon protein C